jgi:hypothetical protein
MESWRRSKNDDAEDARLSKPDSKRGVLQRAVLERLYAHRDSGELPTNGRFIFYELEQLGIVSKAKEPGRARRVDQDTTDALMWLRDKGIVPWGWIVDETRTVHDWNHGRSIADCLVNRLDVARINPWGSEPPLILVESRSLGGVLRGIAAEYVCPLAPTNGQAGGHLRTDVAPYLEGNERPVRYMGDLDRQGGQIEANTRRVLERLTGRTFDGDSWERIAITQAQVDDPVLRERLGEPIRKTDKRYRSREEEECWETEALGQRMVMGLLRDALDELLPEPLADVRKREREQREARADFPAGWEG